MTRVEYIKQLEFSLTGKLSKREVSEILRDYSEYFEAGKAEGKTEAEIAVSLGIPSAVAAQILAENEERHDGQEVETTSIWQRYWKKLSGVVKDFFSSTKTPGYDSADEDGASDIPDSTGAPSAIPPKGKAPAVGPFIKKFFLVLLFLCCLPLVVFAVPAALFVLGALGLAVLSLIVVLLLVSGSSLIVALIGLALAFSITQGSVSLTILFVAFIAFSLAGAVLSVCAAIYLVRGMIRLLRSIFGRQKPIFTARNPAYLAKLVAEGTIEAPTVYHNGWSTPMNPSPFDSAVELPPEAAGSPLENPEERNERDDA